MPDTGYSRSPKLLKGAFVELAEDLVGVVPHVVPFQFNPATFSWSLTPYNPFEGDAATRGQTAPTAQPYAPRETINLELELDASDQLEDGEPVAMATGVADRIAALEKLTQPTKGLIGDVLQAATDLLDQRAIPRPERPSVPIVLFVWGPRRIVPVRLTSFAVEEQLFSPTLYPIQAKVTVALEVLTPDVFKCEDGFAVGVAKAAHRFHRLQQNTLAAAHVAKNIEAIRGLLPF